MGGGVRGEEDEGGEAEGMRGGPVGGGVGEVGPEFGEGEVCGGGLWGVCGVSLVDCRWFGGGSLTDVMSRFKGWMSARSSEWMVCSSESVLTGM